MQDQILILWSLTNKMSDIRKWDEKFWEPDEILWNILFKHKGHSVEIATYGDPEDPVDMCLECLDCEQVILDAEIYTICAREDDKNE